MSSRVGCVLCMALRLVWWLHLRWWLHMRLRWWWVGWLRVTRGGWKDHSLAHQVLCEAHTVCCRPPDSDDPITGSGNVFASLAYSNPSVRGQLQLVQGQQGDHHADPKWQHAFEGQAATGHKRLQSGQGCRLKVVCQRTAILIQSSLQQGRLVLQLSGLLQVHFKNQ